MDAETAQKFRGKQRVITVSQARASREADLAQFRLRQAVYNCTRVVVEWDPAKAQQNVRKHGVSFADAVTVLEDDRALTERDMSNDAEERYATMGVDGLGRVLVVVYTWRGENLRLISARSATQRERRVYEESK